MTNGTDRDIALQIVSDMETISAKIAEINTHLFYPVIFTQPVNVEAALNETATFTVVAGNAAAYQWEYKNLNVATPAWNDMSGYTENVFAITATVTRYHHLYRCKITGLDGSVIYSDEVYIIEPST